MFNYLNNKPMKEITQFSIYAVFAYLEIPIEAFLILVCFMATDSILGIIAAIRCGERFSFGTLMWGYILKWCYIIIPGLIALLGIALKKDYAIVLVITMKILTVSEFYSCLANIYSAKNKVKVKKMDFVSMALKAGRIYLEKKFKSIAKKIEDGNNC